MLLGKGSTSFIDLCIIMTKTNMAATINQPDRPKKYVNIWGEELRIYPKEEEDDGCAKIKSATTRILKDIMIKSKDMPNM